MCILFIAINEHKNFPLIILANRDEFQNRPTRSAQFWEDHPNLLAGRDEQDKGTWLGITKEKRISALTNYRNIPLHKEGRISRGLLVRDFLISNKTAEEYLEILESSKENYNPYNILLGNPTELYVYNNVSNQRQKLEKGFHGLSNAFLNSPWPKLSRGIEHLKKAVLTNQLEKDYLFSLMQDETKATDDLLPDTGVGLDKERFLSSIFLKSEVYGTRSTAILLFDRQNTVSFYEKTYNPKGEVVKEFSASL
ncbi:MAG TPA: NRDE family protein [Leptospiraceae bacterium]|nr:NRDE family protein [Leptospiraceae bacterium]HMW07681.1 NRDE family protein [Leptospiraceae bacterium]HMX33815.1 NRDE family protein [Leptospiraceae bacterium]HMY33305.1 NRDE family protein [Leptospiraceae bacterium]HMZ63042.1 NRDE family protein [Leptospiraceae bacterium]